MISFGGVSFCSKEHWWVLMGPALQCYIGLMCWLDIGKHADSLKVPEQNRVGRAGRFHASPQPKELYNKAHLRHISCPIAHDTRPARQITIALFNRASIRPFHLQSLLQNGVRNHSRSPQAVAAPRDERQETKQRPVKP